MSIYMATTKKSPEQTAGQISSLLAAVGAKSVLTEYEDDGKAIGIAFRLLRGGQLLSFSLPVRWEPVLKAMENDKRTPNHLCHEDQAKRVAWRQIFRWVQAQLALIDVGCVEPEEVFLPYLQVDKTGQTLFEKLNNNQFLLTDGK